MLDNETRRRIDTARDILVGKVPDPKSQVEQITIALIYKFMDDMDKEAIEFGGAATFFTGEYEKYAWTKIFDPKLGGHEMLNLYGDAIVKLNQNPNIPQLFRDIFKNAYLPYRDPETLKLFLKTINEFKYDHSEMLGDAFEYLLSILGSQGDAGQFRTPRHIIDFIVQILEPKKGESICDPACGTAGFLISSYKYIVEQNSKKSKGDLLTPDDRKKLMQNFVGYDISPDMVRLSLVNMYLHGFTTPKIYEYDSLTSVERWNEYFDIIIANPPFMSPKGGVKPHKKFTVKSNRTEVLFTDYILEHINPTTGRAGIIVPDGIIFQSGTSHKSLRKFIVESNFLYAVISLPAGVFQPYSGVKTSILLVDKVLSKKSNEILFVKIEGDGYSLGAQRKETTSSDVPSAIKIIKDYKNHLLNSTNFQIGDYELNASIIQKNTIKEDAEYTLLQDRYSNTQGELTSNYPIVTLEEITTRITKGTTPTTVGYKFEDDGINFVKIESITESGAFIPEKFAKINEACHNSLLRSQLKENDVLFSIAGAFGRVGIVTNEILPANTNQALAIISLKEGVNPKYIFFILKSDIVKNEIDRIKTGVAQFNLSLSQVSNLKIPLPPLEIQDTIVSQFEALQEETNNLLAMAELNNRKLKSEINALWNPSVALV
ncbi:MAG TPA: N-6 DNA methylase [Ignavibacteriaceae bacterium]|nr:N-6 DNA methylase [Ignavibacteriaceae bacterium]